MTGEKSFADVLATKEIVVCCGAGGVGKTSIAAAIALGAASRIGGRVLVLTIDPARRLSTALGRESGSGEGLQDGASRVPPQDLAKAGIPMRGELWAAMLDTKSSWDALVRRHAPDADTANRIITNPLYANMTGRFIQSHDYIAMEKLYEIHAAGEYDLVVVDTPPTRNALDFLEAPARIAELFGGRLIRILTVPTRVGGGRGARAIDAMSRPFTRLADRILGGQFLEDVAQFFLELQSMHDGFVERARVVTELLGDRRTGFVVVSTLEAAPIAEAEQFAATLAQRGHHLAALVLNRTLPDGLRDSGAQSAAENLVDRAGELALALAAASDLLGTTDVKRIARVLRSTGEGFMNMAIVARREAELADEVVASLERSAKGGVSAPEILARVPNVESDIGDLESLARMADALFAKSAPL